MLHLACALRHTALTSMRGVKRVGSQKALRFQKDWELRIGVTEKCHHLLGEGSTLRYP